MEGGPWGGPWKGFIGWSMEGIQGIVHGLGSVFSTLPLNKTHPRFL